MKNKKTLLIIVLTFVILMVGASVLYKSLGDRVETDPLATQKQENNKATGTQESSNASEKQEETTVNNPAPDFTVIDIDGNEHKLSDFKGKPVVLNFWASWCGPCKSEMPDFDEAFGEYKDKIHFLMVNLTDGSQETVETASTYIKEQGYSFPVYYDTMSEAMITYSVYSVPATYFIDAEGNIIANGRGALDKATLQKGIGMIYSE